jgi:hypothetical protein
MWYQRVKHKATTKKKQVQDKTDSLKEGQEVREITQEHNIFGTVLKIQFNLCKGLRYEHAYFIQVKTKGSI